mgnify:FL=1
MRNFYFLIILVFIISCSNNNYEELVEEKIDFLTEKYAPDSRVAIWNVDIDYSKNPIKTF